MINTNESIDKMKIKLAVAEEINESDLTGQLSRIGFECNRCGECCRSFSGDNRVIVFPAEIRKIINNNKKLKWNEVCKPSNPLFIDDTGMLHAFEWELNRHESGDCIFLNDDNKCKIYDQRPWICRTYPFYLLFEDGDSKPSLMVSDCQGCGGSINGNETLEMAISLKKRLIEEIREEIRVLENLENYENWNLITNHLQPDLKTKSRIVVYDSDGKHICSIS